MGILKWFTQNWAETQQTGDPALAPLQLPFPVTETLSRIEATARGLPGWQIEAVDPHAGVLTATRHTRLWRFVDDVTIRVEATASGTRVHARSQSRVGKGDFGQNRRNLLELLTRLRKSIPVR